MEPLHKSISLAYGHAIAVSTLKFHVLLGKPLDTWITALPGARPGGTWTVTDVLVIDPGTTVAGRPPIVTVALRIAKLLPYMTNPIEGGPSESDRLVICGDDQPPLPPLIPKELLEKSEGLVDALVMLAELIVFEPF
jgi:hypothetical protein